MTGRPRHNSHLTQVGRNWELLDRQAKRAADRRKRNAPFKVAGILLLIGLCLLCVAGMVA